MSNNKTAMTDSVFSDKSQWSLIASVEKPSVATEDHLQSLGLEVNDGLPKFRLNEPGPAALSSSVFQQNNLVTDDDSEQSFVVLGKTSIESVRDASLASYRAIQEKSTLPDYETLISMLNKTETENKLRKLLEENVKLKETLKQNNTALKQQFNTITKWQEEVMTVCDNHKQKFQETKELILTLKKENDELKEKIAKSQSQELSQSAGQDPLTYSTCIDKDFIVNRSELFTSYYSESQESTSMPGLLSFLASNNESQLRNEQDLLKKTDKLSEELSNVKVSYPKETKEREKLDSYHTHIEILSHQLHKANKELECYKQKSYFTNSSELQKLINDCCEKDLRLKYLEEIISSLEIQIKKLEENGLPLADLHIEPSQEISEDKQQLREKIEFYNAKLSDLNKCFASQCSRYLRIQECLRESAFIIQTLENSDILPNYMITEEKLKNYLEKLRDFRKILITEQLQSIDDKQATIKTQQQFQKILSDYNSVLCELEILKDENSKLLTLQAKAEEENSQKWEEIEKQLNEERRILEKEKTELLEASLKVQIDKKMIVEEKRQIETDRNHLSLAEENLQEERINLSEERTSLDRQSKLYEAEVGTLQAEKRVLEKKCDYLCCETVKLKHDLHEAELTIRLLQTSNIKLKENEELLTVYKIQTEVREKEFEDMRAMHKNLQDQLQALSFANLQLRSENDRLGGQGRQERNCDESVDRQFVNVLVCPKCRNGFEAGTITAHLQQCMNSH